MRLKAVSGIMLILLLMGMFTLAFKVQPVAAVDWWPMFRHDPSRTGYSTSTAPNTNNTIWNFTAGSRVTSSPAVADGRVYVASIFDFNVYCLDALTGAHIWNYRTGGKMFSSPAVADGKVFVGSYDNNVYCLDASTGAHIWSYRTGDWVVSSPAVAYGRVYVGSDDYKVYAFGPPPPVGGKATPINVPMNKPETPALWIWLSTIIVPLVLTLVYVKKRKRNTKINS